MDEGIRWQCRECGVPATQLLETPEEYQFITRDRVVALCDDCAREFGLMED